MTIDRAAETQTSYVPPRAMYTKAAASLTAFGGMMTAVAVNGRNAAVYLADAFVVVAAAFLVRMLFRMAVRKPMVVLSAEGLVFGYRVFVPWSLIASVSIRRRLPGHSVNKYDAISFEVTDQAAYLAAVGWAYRRNARIWVAQGDGPLRIAASCLPVPMEEAVAEMRRHHPGLVVRP